MNDAAARHSLGFLAAIVVILGAASLAKTASLEGPYGLDASYYIRLARHVANGDGLITTTSLYHQGLHLPSKSLIPPLWILALGYTGRVIGVAQAAVVLPKLFYLLDLILLYFVARAVAVRLGALRFSERWYVPDAAHCVTLLLGLNASFFAVTTHPYREGISFAAAFGCLLAFERCIARRSLVAAAACGALAALGYLGRDQMAAAGIGVVVALALEARRDRFARVALVVVIVSGLVVVAPWFVFLQKIPLLMHGPEPAREILPVLQDAPRSMTALQLAYDTLEGLGVAFHLGSPYAYSATFGPAALIVPLALLAVLLRLRSAKFGAPDPVVMATFIAGLLLIVTLLPYRSDYLPFVFGWRHGITLIFMLIVAVPYLLSRWKWIAGVLIVASVVMGAWNVAKFIHAPNFEFTSAERQLFQWLAAQPKPVTLLTTHPQPLGVGTDAYIHGTFCGSTPDATRAFLKRLPIDYVLVYEDETNCSFQRGLGRDLRLVHTFGSPGRRLYVLAPFAPVNRL